LGVIACLLAGGIVTLLGEEVGEWETRERTPAGTILRRGDGDGGGRAIVRHDDYGGVVVDGMSVLVVGMDNGDDASEPRMDVGWKREHEETQETELGDEKTGSRTDSPPFSCDKGRLG
jgi:hypothetical protein